MIIRHFLVNGILNNIIKDLIQVYLNNTKFLNWLFKFVGNVQNGKTNYNNEIADNIAYPNIHLVCPAGKSSMLVDRNRATGAI